MTFFTLLSYQKYQIIYIAFISKIIAKNKKIVLQITKIFVKNTVKKRTLFSFGEIGENEESDFDYVLFPFNKIFLKILFKMSEKNTILKYLIKEIFQNKKSFIKFQYGKTFS